MRVEYHGAAFHGWQIQRDVVTAEGVLTDAVETITGARVKVWGASRTDAGVHARGQVAAFDYAGPRRLDELYHGLNHLTPDALSIAAIDEVDDSFHPRHSARGKVYRYHLWPHFDRSPFLVDRTWQVRGAVDVGAMSAAAGHLVGEHDYSAFRASGCQASSPVRRLWEVSVRRRRDGRVTVQVAGSAFLKYMVRNLVGTLVEVGRGKRAPEWVAEVLAGRARCAAGPTADAKGLVLDRVFHPDHPWVGAFGAVRNQRF